MNQKSLAESYRIPAITISTSRLDREEHVELETFRTSFDFFQRLIIAAKNGERIESLVTENREATHESLGALDAFLSISGDLKNFIRHCQRRPVPVVEWDTAYGLEIFYRFIGFRFSRNTKTEAIHKES